MQITIQLISENNLNPQGKITNELPRDMDMYDFRRHKVGGYSKKCIGTEKYWRRYENVTKYKA